MAEHTCTRCGETKPREDFYKDKRRKSGLYSWCKTCFKSHCRSTYDPELTKARRQRWVEERGGREKTAARVAAWRAANPERWAAWCEANSAKAVARAKAWAEANPERATLTSRRAANKRRARKRDQSAEPVDYAEVLAEHGMWCYLCETDIASLDDLHFDHVIPLSKGGPHTAENIRPTHADCNLRKHARLIL